MEKTKIESLRDLINPSILENWIKNKGLEDMGSILSLVDIINDNNIEENIIWHYTKLDVLEKMLLPDGVNIRLTNIKYLSDTSEFLVFRSFLTKNIEKILNKLKTPKMLDLLGISENDELLSILEDLSRDLNKLKNDKTKSDYNSYVFSMSRLKNSFAFWNKAYAGEDGVAIGFKRDKIMEKFPKNILDVIYVEPDSKIQLTDSIAIEYASQLIGLFYKDFCNMSSFDEFRLNFLIGNVSALFKNKSWQHEQETRMIINDVLNALRNNEIKCVGNKFMKFHYESFDKDVIKYIMLGPTCGDVQVEAVSDYLTSKGYNHVEISKSKIFDLRHDF